MNDNTHTTSFSVGHDSYTISLANVSSASVKPTPKALNKKYNVLVRKEDLILLSHMQSLTGETRTSLLNELLGIIMTRFLMSNGDKSARLAIAKWADEKSGLLDQNESWVTTALKTYISDIQYYLEKYHLDYEPDPREIPDGPIISPEYAAVISKLKGK